MKDQLSVYLAGPFFNPTQITTIRKLESELEMLGLKVYSPSRDGKKLDMSTDGPELRTAVFRDNVDNLTECDIVVAVIDDRDTGTMWEMGCRYGRWMDKYANSKNKLEDAARFDCPIIVTYTDHDYGVNLMLLESIAAHCKGVDELRVYLNKLMEEGISRIKRDTDSTRRIEVI